METTVIIFPTENEVNPYENTTYTPCSDKLNKATKFTGKFKKDGSPKVKRKYSPFTVQVYGELMRRSKSKNTYPKIQTMADRLNCSYATVQRAIDTLTDDCVIFVRKTGRASMYYFVPLDEDGHPNENSGEYIVAKALLDRKNAKSDLAKNEITYNNKETKNPVRVFLSVDGKQSSSNLKAELLSIVPQDCKIPFQKIIRWINTAIKHFPDEAVQTIKDTLKAETPAKYFWKIYNLKTKKSDTEKPESLKKETSNENPPPNPQKEPAVKEQPSRAEIQKQNEDIEKSIDDHIESLSHEKRIDLLKEMRIKFNNFQKTRSRIMYRDLERDCDKLFKDRAVRGYIETRILK